MTTVKDTYLGWELLGHFEGCKRPPWTVDAKCEDDAFRARHDRPEHACPNEECHHGDRYTRTTVRIVCTGCQMAHVIRGEEGISRGSTSTTTHGYGQPPRKVAGLLLWPGEPLLSWGRLSTEDPWDFLITRTGVSRVAEGDVVGVINQVRGARGAVRWSVVAVRSEAGPYGLSPLRFAHGEERMASVAAAAKWTAARLAEAPTGGAE